VFSLNFFAIIPLAAVLSFATEEIASRLGETLGGLVNATFGNAVELIVSIVALRAGEIEVVQASMLGSILSNLLLVLGMCFLLGGIYNMRSADGHGMEQSFSQGTAQTTCSLMALASASMILPAALYGVLDQADEDHKQESILILSRGTSIVLLLLYVLYLYFALRTHKKLFEPETQSAASAEEEHEPLLGPWSAGLVLVVTTIIISVCADYMVDSIDALVATGKISKTFIGLILIPIVGNAAEHVTACVVAVKDKMDLAMGVAIGSSIQIALLVTPALVMLGWAIGQPMTLHFETCTYWHPNKSYPACCPLRLIKTNQNSRNRRFRPLRARRHLHRPRRQIQLPRGRHGMSTPAVPYKTNSANNRTYSSSVSTSSSPSPSGPAQQTPSARQWHCCQDSDFNPHHTIHTTTTTTTNTPPSRGLFPFFCRFQSYPLYKILQHTHVEYVCGTMTKGQREKGKGGLLDQRKCKTGKTDVRYLWEALWESLGLASSGVWMFVLFCYWIVE